MELKDLLQNVKMLVLDVDGVLTDGRLWIDSNGDWKRCFSVLDGVGIKRIIEAGYIVAVISGGQSEDVRQRLEFLGLEHIYLGISNKEKPFGELLKITGLQSSQVAYCGDDIFDLPLIKEVACGISVPNGLDEVRSAASYITHRSGGFGAVREICDALLNYGPLNKN